MTKKNAAQEQTRKTMIPGRRTHILTLNRASNIGKTTEIVGAIEFLHQAGFSPALISGDPKSNVLKDIYAARDPQTGVTLKQELGAGVVTIDLQAKQGAYVNMLYNWDGDTILDSKGGVLDDIIEEYTDLAHVFNSFPDDRFIFISPISDPKKAFNHLQVEFENIACADTETEIHIVNIFSKGKIGNDTSVEEIMDLYHTFRQTHNYNDSSIKPKANVTVHEALFKTMWNTPAAIDFFATKKIREASLLEKSNNKIIANNFLNERDRFWSKILVTPEEHARLCAMPKWDKPAETWGKVIAS